MKSVEEEEIVRLIKETDDAYDLIKDKAESLYSAFVVIEILCLMNMTFFLQNVVNYIFTKKLGRFYQFPTLAHISDTILFCCSIIILRWFQLNIEKDLYTDGRLD